MTNHFLAGEGAIFIQPYGPNTKTEFLGCHMVGDISEPKGDVTLYFCDDPSGPNRFNIKSSSQGAPGVVTTTITTDVEKTASYLERLSGCTFPLYINLYQCGRSDQFPNYHRTFQLQKARVTNRGLTGISAMTPDDQARSQQTFDVSAVAMSRAWITYEGTKLDAVATQVQPAWDIDFLNRPGCTDNCGAYRGLGDIAVIACGTAVNSDIVYTLDAGANWTTVASSFAAADIMYSAKIFQYNNGIRVLGARELLAGTVMQVEAFDNWVAGGVVGVGATLAQGILTHQGLYVYDGNNIWLIVGGAAGGEIFFSNDGGGTWTQQLSSMAPYFIAGQVPHAIHGSDNNRLMAVGTTGIVLTSDNGGDTWELKTPLTGTPIGHCLWKMDQNRAWVGITGGNGQLFYTTDNGTTWNERLWANSSVAGQITAVKFYDELNGYLLFNNGTPKGTFYRTRNGGYTWELVTTKDNDNLNGLFLVGPNEAWAAGDNAGSTAALVLKAA